MYNKGINNILAVNKKLGWCVFLATCLPIIAIVRHTPLPK